MEMKSMKYETEEKMMRDWTKLPEEILELICKRLPMEEQVQFGIVCKNWLSSSSNKSLIYHPDTPWLINNDDTTARFHLLNVPDQKLYKIHKPYKPLFGTIIFGSFKGWLFMRSESNSNLFLLNIFSRLRILLPPQTTIPSFLSSKGENISGQEIPLAYAMSTCNHLNPISVATITVGGDLAWCNMGDERWNGYRSDKLEYGNVGFHDEKMYCVNRDGDKLDIFKLNVDKVVLLASIDICIEPNNKFIDVYLVECGERLLVVRKYYDFTKILLPTSTFEIFRVEEHGSEPGSLVRIQSLEEHVLFMDETSCQSLPFEECRGLQRGHIYFTGFCREAATSDLGEFEVSNGFLRRTPLPYSTDLYSPIWVIPHIASPCNCCQSAVTPWVRSTRKSSRKIKSVYFLRSKEK